MIRTKITQIDCDKALCLSEAWFANKLLEKGYGSFSSIHELIGVLDEVVSELKEAIYQNSYKNIEIELKDVIVVALFGLSCLKAGTMDW